MAGSTDLKSKSRVKENPLYSKLRLLGSGELSEQFAASWKVCKKRSPWLKQLKPHQVWGTEAVVSQSGFAALFAQRTGKTWVTGAVLDYERDYVHDVLLVGPLTNLESTWLKFFMEKLPHYSVFRDLPSYLAHRKSIGKLSIPNDHCVLLLNYEAVTPILSKLRRIKWDRCIYDEAQRIKNRTSRSSRDAALLGKSCARRLALTGTPMDLDPKDLWAIMRFVEPNVLGTVWKNFSEDFLVQSTIDLTQARGAIQRKKMILAHQIATRKAPLRPELLPHYAELLSPHVGRISKEDAGIEPARVRHIRFELSPQEERQYRQLEKHMVVKVKGRTIKTPLKITQIGKLQQLTGGFIKDEDGEVHRVGKSKAKLLKRLIKENVHNREPFVVFCKFVHEVHMIAKLLKKMKVGRIAKLWGKVKDIKTDKRRTNMLLGFQRGEFDAIVCQQRTGGVGVDLYRARKFFVYSMGHSFIDYDQMVSRGDFLDQTEPAEFFVLSVRWSIDTDIIVCHKKKRSISKQFYDRLHR